MSERLLIVSDPFPFSMVVDFFLDLTSPKTLELTDTVRVAYFYYIFLTYSFSHSGSNRGWVSLKTTLRSKSGWPSKWNCINT